MSSARSIDTDLLSLSREYKSRANLDATAAARLAELTDAESYSRQIGLLYLQALEKELTSETFLFLDLCGNPFDLENVIRQHDLELVAKTLIQLIKETVGIHANSISDSERAALDRAIDWIGNTVALAKQGNWIHNNLRYPKIDWDWHTGLVRQWSTFAFSLRDAQDIADRYRSLQDLTQNLHKLLRSIPH